MMIESIGASEITSWLTNYAIGNHLLLSLVFLKFDYAKVNIGFHFICWDFCM